jgi:Mrp family chromosome partitioning ATPase
LRDLPLQASEPSVDSIEVRTAAVLGKTVADPKLSAVSREQYRQLAATLHNAQAENGLKAVMIASAVGGEGKTLTAANLALTFAESYRRRVLLVDADLRGHLCTVCSTFASRRPSPSDRRAPGHSRSGR